MHIADATFVVTDTETTGIDARRNRVIELAAVKVQGGEVVDRFSSLINPGCAVPRRITALTGISTGMVFDQPRMVEVLPAYLDFLGDGIFVAHNLGFDQRFLNAELERLALPPLANPTLCTLRLARRLLAGLPSKALAHVAAHFGLKPGAHRALGDATVTADILVRFLDTLTEEQGLETLEDLLAFQHRTYRQAQRIPSHLTRIREEVLPQLPPRPGVYFMQDRKGNIIYIGKAKRLADRVRSYFTAIEAHDRHHRRLVNTVRDVTWTETGSELAALLLESRLIKAHKPRFNRAQRRYRNRPFIRFDTTGPYPHLSLQRYLTDDGAEYFGPMASSNQGERVIELINRCYLLRECDEVTFSRGKRCLYADIERCLAPCEGGQAAAYADEVKRVRAFLMGQDRSVLTRLDASMRAAAARLDFEEARLHRDWLQTVETMLDRQQHIASPVLKHDAVLVLPGVMADTVQLLLVRFGRHVASLTVTVPIADEARAALRKALHTHFDPTLPRPERYMKAEIEEVRLLAHWMYVHRDATAQVRWSPERQGHAFESDVLAALHAAVPVAA